MTQRCGHIGPPPLFYLCSLCRSFLEVCGRPPGSLWAMALPIGKWHQLRTSQPNPRELIGRAENIRVSLVSDRPGLVEFQGSPGVVVSIHVGPSVEADCRRGGERHRGTTIHGDIEIIPPNLPGTWEIRGSDSALVVGLGLELLRRAAGELGADPGRFE